MSYNDKSIALSVRGLSKSYKIYNRPQDRLKQFVLPRIQKILKKTTKKYYNEFWALHGAISFDVRRGETLGVIGRNGSGKSTLLQIIAGTLTPTTGKILAKGRIAALLELGSGFNAEFTGRENVYLNAALLGLTPQEVDEKINDIVDFADIGEFIEQPVKRYSSGMIVRLAFAVQAQIDPDILIVDEALAVGDAKFQEKCFERLRQLQKNGTSILLVSHSDEQILTHCTRALFLNGGHLRAIGKPEDVVNLYRDTLIGEKRETRNALEEQTVKRFHVQMGEFADKLNDEEDVFYTRPGYNKYEYRWGDKRVTILDYLLSVGNVFFPSSVDIGQLITLKFSIKFHKKLSQSIFGFVIRTKEGVLVYGKNSASTKVNGFSNLTSEEDGFVVQVSFRCDLAPGDYFISVGLASKQGDKIIPHDRRYSSIHLLVSSQSGNEFSGLVNLNADLRVSPSLA